MSLARLLVGITLFMIASVGHSSIISFTPSGTSTVSQGTNIYWDMLSDSTSTSPLGAIGNFYLSGHGDIHFSSSTADMINAGTGTAGVNLSLGTLIDASSNWLNTNSFVGTTGFGGGCIISNTCIYGLSIELAGQTHYGWLQFSENSSTQSLLGWGYESVANTGILAGATAAAVPEPATLALFGIGLAGMGFARKKKKSA